MSDGQQNEPKVVIESGGYAQSLSWHKAASSESEVKDLTFEQTLPEISRCVSLQVGYNLGEMKYTQASFASWGLSKCYHPFISSKRSSDND